eukprot:Anaeramoba_flamelloidesa807767_185.p1 GENE.a807767_185~~a807767_185.p1  ORF type:complete len:466 (+),score=31.04 a807767_185:560-1957(+)
MKMFIFLLILLSNYVYANIAKVTTLAGGVNIIRESKTIEASKNFELLEKDIVKTNKEGRAQLLFTDNTIISVGYNSTFSIDEYINDTNKPPKASFGLRKGVFKSITGNIGKLNPDRFKLKTKSASIGIRGTTILAQVQDGAEKIICTEGGIRVENEGGWVDVNPGEKTILVQAKAPSMAQIALQEEINELEKNSGAIENEKESAATQAKKNKNEKNESSDNDNSINASDLNTNNTNNDISSLTNSGYENDLANSNVSSNIYYKSSLTNYYNQSSDEFTTRQRLITKDNSDNALSSVDGSYGDYLSWGHWGVTDDTSESKSDYSGSTYEGRSYWISGILTPASDVPQSGSATYTGSITGNIIRDASNSSKVGSNLSGTTSIIANFGSNTMSGTFNVDNFVNANLSGVTMSRESYGVTFSGDLSGSDVSSGSISGAFYGTDAAAVGGLWTIEDTSQNAADGTFAATK